MVGPIDRNEQLADMACFVISVAARLLYEHVIGSRTRLLQKSRKAA